MNEILKELYDIEERASQMIKNAGKKQQEIMEESLKKEEMIARELIGEMEGRLTILETQLEEKAKKEMEEAAEKNAARIAALHENYNENYPMLAKEIVKRITEV